MKNNTNSVISLTSILFLLFIGGKFPQKNTQNKISTINNYNFIDINQCYMWLENNGLGSIDPRTGNSGFLWSNSETSLSEKSSIIFTDGLNWGGIVDSEVRANGSRYRTGMQSGKILNSGNADNPDLDKYRVFKIFKYWKTLPPGPKRDLYEKDYNEWPVEDGAPWNDLNGDGIFTRGVDTPRYIGDETLWFVANDLDSSLSIFWKSDGEFSRAIFVEPIGIEMQVTTYGFDRPDFLKNVIFKKYKLINKGQHTVKNMYLGYWSDPDLGYSGNDYAGCDSVLNLGYCFNASDDDAFVGAPPAVGYVMLKGPKSNPESAQSEMLRMTSFSFLLPSSDFFNQSPDSVTPQHFYNYFQGLEKNGDKIVNPVSGDTTKYMFSGDPVDSTGWFEGINDSLLRQPPGNVRMMLSSGPFNFAPGDTQEVEFAIIVAQGLSALQSVAELKKEIPKLKIFYNAYKPDKGIPIDETPTDYSISQNYPNPFNPTTTINYTLPENEFVTIKVYNIIGETVAVLVNEEKPIGKYSVNFNASNLASGIYIYRIEAGRFEVSKKMILLR